MSTRKSLSQLPDPHAAARREFDLLVEVLGAGLFRSGLSDRRPSDRPEGREDAERKAS